MTVVDIVKKSYVDAQDSKLGIPVVVDNADRAAQYPVPLLNQYVRNLSSGDIERYNGIAWETSFEGVSGTKTRYNTKAVGLAGDSIIDDYAKLNTLVNATMQPSGGEVDVIGVVRIGSNITIPANVTLNFRSNASIAPDIGVTVTINGKIFGPYTKRFGTGGDILFGTSRAPRMSPVWWGALLDGAADDTIPLVKAIKAIPVTIGGCVKIGSGMLRTTGNGSNISAAIDSKRSVSFLGRNKLNWRGVNNPPFPTPSTIYIKELTGPFYTKSNNTNEALSIYGVAFDGSNGGGTANGSLTCPGVVAANGFQLNFFEAKYVVATDLKYAHAPYIGPTGRAAFDLGLCVFASFTDCFIGVMENGRALFTDTGSTTVRVTRTYFSGLREIAYHRGTIGVTYTDSVGESSVVGIIGFLSSIHYTGKCHFENLGQNTGAAAWVTGLAPRNHGLGGALGALLAGNVNTAFNQLYGSWKFDEPVFNSLKPGGPLVAWMECLGGAFAGTGDGGSLSIKGGSKRISTDVLFAATMAFGTTERGIGFITNAEESGSTSPAESLFGGATGATDARKLNTGFARINRNDLSASDLVRVARGNFIYESQELPTAFAAKPTATQYPRGDQFLRGDLIRFSSAGLPSSSLGAFMLECTGSGTANPTWALVAQVEAPSVDRGDASVVLVSLSDQVIQMFQSAITVPRTMTLPAPANSFARQRYHVVRSGLGAGTLTVQTSAAVALKVLPAATAVWADFIFSGAANEWILDRYGTL